MSSKIESVFFLIMSAYIKTKKSSVETNFDKKMKVSDKISTTELFFWFFLLNQPSMCSKVTSQLNPPMKKKLCKNVSS